MSINAAIVANSAVAVPTEAPASGVTKPALEANPTGRNARGQFTPGNRGGPGNPGHRRAAALRKELLTAATTEDLDHVLDALLFQAKAGDLAAIQVLLEYTIGQPAAASDPDPLDLPEEPLRQQAAVPPATVEDGPQALPATTIKVAAQIFGPGGDDAPISTAPAAAVPQATASPGTTNVSPRPALGNLSTADCRPISPAPTANGGIGNAAHRPDPPTSMVTAPPGSPSRSWPVSSHWDFDRRCRWQTTLSEADTGPSDVKRGYRHSLPPAPARGPPCRPMTNGVYRRFNAGFATE